MAVETVFVAALRNWPGLGQVSAYPERAPAGAVPPYIVYTQYAGDREQNLDGDAGLGNPRFQFDVYDKTKSSVTELKVMVRQALQAVDALNAVFQSDGSGYEDDTKLFRHRQDFSMWFND